MQKHVIPAAPKLALTPPTGRDWLHEVKFDGWRVQIHVSGGAVCLLSRNGNDLSKRFSRGVSELAVLAQIEGVIDGGSVRVDHGRAGLAVLGEARRMTSDHRCGQDNANGGIPEAAG